MVAMIAQCYCYTVPSESMELKQALEIFKACCPAVQWNEFLVIFCFRWFRSTIACQDQQNKKSRGDCRQDQETGGAGDLHGNAAEERPHDHAGGIGHHEHGETRIRAYAVSIPL